jgi:hypothetical protein
MKNEPQLFCYNSKPKENPHYKYRNTQRERMWHRKKAKEILFKREEKRLFKEKTHNNRNNKSLRKIQNLQKEVSNVESIPYFKKDNSLHNLSKVLLMTIPRELLHLILSFLSPTELTKLLMVCEFFQNMLNQLIPRSPRLYSKHITKSNNDKISVTWKNYDIPKDSEQFFFFIRFDWTKQTYLIPIEQENRNQESKLTLSGIATLPSNIHTSVYYYLQLVVVNSFGSSSSRWVRMK